MTETIIEEKITVKQETQVRDFYERTFPRVAAFVSRMGGRFEDAKDLFHDALVSGYLTVFILI